MAIKGDGQALSGWELVEALTEIGNANEIFLSVSTNNGSLFARMDPQNITVLDNLKDDLEAP